MEKRIRDRVREEDRGIRLGVFLRRRLHLTKNEVSRAKFREEGICVNGERRKVNALLEAGDVVEVLLETREETSRGLTASQGVLSVLYEDQDVIAVDKPSGLTVHPSGGRNGDTLANRLAAYLRNKGEDSVIRIFGRLDKDTSGVVLAVKNRAAATRLERQREEGMLFKRYLAVVEGIPRPMKGRIEAPLGPSRKKRNQMCTDPEGKRAVTCYETLEVQGEWAVVRLRLETGRTHQIRVHMASVGCPLMGDPLYGNGGASGIKRTALHAQALHFFQPFTGQELLLEAPVPDDMRMYILVSAFEDF